MKGTTNVQNSYNFPNIGEISQNKSFNDNKHLLCDGSEIDSNTYSDLYNILGINLNSSGSNWVLKSESSDRDKFYINSQTTTSYIYFNDIHIVLYGDYIWTSNDGINWIYRLNISSGDFWGSFTLFIGNLMIGITNGYYYTRNGINWSYRNTSALSNGTNVRLGSCSSVCCAVVLSGSAQHLFSTTDLNVWTERNLPIQNNTIDGFINARESMLLLIGGQGYSSSDGISWNMSISSIGFIDYLGTIVGSEMSSIMGKSSSYPSTKLYGVWTGSLYIAINADYQFAIPYNKTILRFDFSGMTHYYMEYPYNNWIVAGNLSSENPYPLSYEIIGYGNKQFIGMTQESSYPYNFNWYGSTAIVTLPKYSVEAYIRFSEGGA